MYKLIKNDNGQVSLILHTETNAFIPMSNDNTDYQAYLKWVAEGNTPEPAENT